MKKALIIATASGFMAQLEMIVRMIIKGKAMKLEENFISIIVPVYNAASYLEETIRSIQRQSIQSWEVIFIDDASTDKSVKLIRKYCSEKIRLIELKKNQGAAAARNAGIRAARGRFLCYLDADDYWSADKLKKQYLFMQEKRCAFSFTGYEFADSSGKRNGKVVHVPEQLTYKEALTNTTISTITVMLDRKQIPDELLFMPEDCSREDTATWWRILRNGYTAYGLDEAMSVYRRHKGSHSANKLRAVMGTWRMYRKQEGLSIGKTMVCMMGYLMRAVRRRLA